MKGKEKQSLLRKALVLILWLSIWQLIYLLVGQDVLVASPVQVAVRLTVLMGEPDFWLSAGSSLFRVLTGFLLALAAGVLLAVLTSAFPAARDFFAPAIAAIKATPVVSFIILALIWLNRDLITIFISFLMVLPVAWTNVSQGIARTDPKLLEMGFVFRFSRGKMLRSIYLPSVMPFFLTAVTAGIGMAWKAGIAAEVIGIPLNSIGRHLYNAKIYLETADLFAWTLAVILMSMLAENTLVRLIRRLGRKYNAQQQKENLKG